MSPRRQAEVLRDQADGHERLRVGDGQRDRFLTPARPNCAENSKRKIQQPRATGFGVDRTRSCETDEGERRSKTYVATSA
jgi:hypothetical protein